MGGFEGGERFSVDGCGEVVGGEGRAERPVYYVGEGDVLICLMLGISYFEGCEDIPIAFSRNIYDNCSLLHSFANALA